MEPSPFDIAGPQIRLASSEEPLPPGIKLDLGSGSRPREDFEAVDLYAPDAKYRVNLWKFPWPFEDGVASELHCSHFIEHIPACYCSPDNVYREVPQDENDVDLLVRFFDECYRILAHGGRMTLLWPALQSVRAFQDPTHRRFIPMEMMQYLNRTWREANGLGHYLGNCNFEMVSTGFSPSSLLEQQGRLGHPEAVQQAILRNWNLIGDFQAMLKAVKPEASL